MTSAFPSASTLLRALRHRRLNGQDDLSTVTATQSEIHMHRQEFIIGGVSHNSRTPESMHFSERRSPSLHIPDEFGQNSVSRSSDQDRTFSPNTSPVMDFTREQMMGSNRRPERPYLAAPPLSLRTMTSSMSMPEISYRDRSGTDSPTHQMQYMPTPPFPILRHGSLEEPTSSPRPDRLPSFRQLSKIADGCTETSDVRSNSYPALPTNASTLGSQSPVKSLPYFNTASQQSSPSANFTMLNHPSPTNLRQEPQETYVIPHSPASYPVPDQHRYPESRRTDGKAKAPGFLSHTSSSNDTTGSYQSSGAESYNTADTDMHALDGSSNHMSSLSLGMQHSPPIHGVFVCDYQGCTAPPFQTQYLLKYDMISSKIAIS